MSETNPPISDPSILNFYVVEGRPVMINGLTHEGWVWQGGSWTSDLGLAQKSFTKGLSLSQDDFVHRFPDAALALLDDQKTRDGELRAAEPRGQDCFERVEARRTNDL